jgi:hypothetical protein
MTKLLAWIKAQITSPLAAKVERTFLVAFVAQWAVVGNSFDQKALTSAVAAALTAVLNGYVVPTWREYKAGNADAGEK